MWGIWRRGANGLVRAEELGEFSKDGGAYAAAAWLSRLHSNRPDEFQVAPVTPCSALALVQSGDQILCVWNKKFDGWALPGGRVEPGEMPSEAVRRELLEEAKVKTASGMLVYQAPLVAADGVWRQVFIYDVRLAPGELPTQGEEGCPVMWMTREELIKASPFATWTKLAFEALAKKSIEDDGIGDK
jgi:ADP-ribose pyrophosphatase YjhB (NUDIX family)